MALSAQNRLDDADARPAPAPAPATTERRLWRSWIVYSLSSVAGRLVGFLMLPIYTRVLGVASTRMFPFSGRNAETGVGSFIA